MTPTSFEGMLFDVKKSMTYYVEADGVKSPTYTMTVVELPAVDDARARVRLSRPTPGCAAEGGSRRRRRRAARHGSARARSRRRWRRRAGGCSSIPASRPALATQADGALTGSFKIGEDGYYHVELDGPRGEKVTASPKYTIDVIEDQRADRVVREAEARHVGESGRRSLRPGARRRRLRREAARPRLLGERRRRKRP